MRYPCEKDCVPVALCGWDGSRNSREAMRVCLKTAKKYAKMAGSGRAAELLAVGGGGRKAGLAGFERAIIDEVETNNCHTLQQVADMAFEKAGVEAGAGAIRRLFKKYGLQKYKCAPLPAKAGLAEQRKFHDNIFMELIAMAKEGMIKLYFLDASHFVFGGINFLGSVWGTARRFVNTYAGRGRYNVLGALGFMAKELATVRNSTSIKKEQVVLLLEKISRQSLFAAPYAVLDKAAYQDCPFVKKKAGELGVQLVFLPAYSPNLNLIERVWKLSKSELRKKSYSNFSECKDAVDSILVSLQTSLKDKIDNLATENFQLYDDIEKIDVNSYVNKKAVKAA